MARQVVAPFSSPTLVFSALLFFISIHVGILLIQKLISSYSLYLGLPVCAVEEADESS